MDVENPEDANELDIYKRLRDIERRIDQLDEKHNKLREDYQFRGGRRKKTRRKQKKKKRHIITRKKKRKRRRRRRTKKKRKGGMPKGPAPKKTGLLLPNKVVIKPKHRRLKELKRGLTRSPTVRNLQQLIKFKPIAKETETETEEQSQIDTDSELINIFENMQTPTEGSRRHNMKKTLSSPKPK